ncbi:unnamed protein product [Gadus morhua 'NCC']
MDCRVDVRSPTNERPEAATLLSHKWDGKSFSAHADAQSVALRSSPAWLSGSFPIWLVLGFCAVMVVAAILLLQSLFLASCESLMKQLARGQASRAAEASSEITAKHLR